MVSQMLSNKMALITGITGHLKFSSWIIFTAFMSGFVPQLQAAENTSDRVRKVLEAKFPDIKIDRVEPAGIAGLYEVATPTEIVYADATGAHLILGQIMDTASKQNLTEARWSELNKIEFESLPKDKAIKIIKGDGSRQLAVFADPFCPYCKELEQTLQNVDNLTVYLYLYPLEGLHPGASVAARDIWCAPDRATAWTTWMLMEQAPDEKDCDDKPIESLAKLGEQLKINSTPTLFFADGSRLPGTVAVDKLEQKLSIVAR